MNINSYISEAGTEASVERAFWTVSKNGRRQLLMATETCTEKYVEKRIAADPRIDQICQGWGAKIIHTPAKISTETT
jgi:hypothetical protein